MKKLGLIGILAIAICILAGNNLVMAQDTHVVKSGECLWNIASSNGVTVDSIRNLNNLNSDLLKIGQVLILNSPATTPAPAVTPAPAPVPAQTAAPEVAPVPAVVPAPAIPLAAMVSPTTDYLVQSGDTLWGISIRYGTTVANLRAINGLTSDTLRVGQTLKVSGTATIPAGPTVSRSGSSVSGDRVVAKAAEYLGTPYRYGGSSPAGFDCSGFTKYIFSQFDISLNRSSSDQYSNGVAVSRDELLPGDLVFFNTYGGISHVGIYCGNGKFIHSSSPSSGGVIYSSLSEKYYAPKYVGARRVIR